MTPTARTLAAQRKLGRTCQVVEKWNPYGGARKPDGTAVGNRVDLFGIIDIIAIDKEGIIGIQATSGTNFLARAKKAEAEPRLREWLSSGGQFQIWGWRKLRARWVARTRMYFLEGGKLKHIEADVAFHEV